MKIIIFRSYYSRRRREIFLGFFFMVKNSVFRSFYSRRRREKNDLFWGGSRDIPGFSGKIGTSRDLDIPGFKSLSITMPGNGGNRVNRPHKFRRPSGGTPRIATPGMGMDLKQTPGIPTVPGVKPREQETMIGGRLANLLQTFLKLENIAPRRRAVKFYGAVFF